MPEERTVRGLHAWLLPQIESLAGISVDSRVLDCGCGTGAWLQRLRAAGFQHLTGIDRRNDLAGASDIQFIQGDFDHLAAAELPAFDLVTAIEIIEHVANPEALIEVATRHLSPNGWLVITTPNIYSLRARVRFLLTSKLFSFEQNYDPEHIHPMVLDAFKRVILRKYPLTLERVLTYPPHGSDGSRWFARAAERALSLAFSNDLAGDILCLMLRKTS